MIILSLFCIIQTVSQYLYTNLRIFKIVPQLSVKVNEVDNKGDLALDLALKSNQTGIAQTLVANKADVNRKDNSGKCLLYKAIQRG